jgi:hypothetical protein
MILSGPHPSVEETYESRIERRNAACPTPEMVTARGVCFLETVSSAEAPAVASVPLHRWLSHNLGRCDAGAAERGGRLLLSCSTVNRGEETFKWPLDVPRCL